jgi:hypothetical protein
MNELIYFIAGQVGDDEEMNGGEELRDSKIDGKLPDLFEGGTMRGYQMEGFQWLVVPKM